MENLLIDLDREIASTRRLLERYPLGKGEWQPHDKSRTLSALSARIRYWDEEQQSGLAVVDIPAKFVEALGGRRQMRVSGTLNGKPFTGATMLVRDGGFCVGVTKAAMSTSRIAIGDTLTVSLKPVAKH